jgi:hypothetical protein
VLKISFKNIWNFYMSIIHFSEDVECLCTCTIFVFLAISYYFIYTRTVFMLFKFFSQLLKHFLQCKILGARVSESNSLEVSVSIIINKLTAWMTVNWDKCKLFLFALPHEPCFRKWIKILLSKIVKIRLTCCIMLSTSMLDI